MITIIDYGVGNLFSLSSSLSYLGLENKVSRDPEDLRKADHIILPGVGAYGDGLLLGIAEKLLGQLEERAARSGYQLTHTARVGPALAAKARSPYGARELRRQVDRAVEQAFADQIASGSVSLGQHWTADCAEDGTIVVQETQTAGVG